MRFHLTSSGQGQIRRNSPSVLLTLAGIAALIGGCGGSITERRADTPIPAKTPTRIINALVSETGLTMVDVASPSEIQSKRLPTGSASGYAMVTAGTVSISLTDSANSAEQVASLSATVGNPDDYSTLRSRSIVAFGVKGATDEGRSPAAYILSDGAKPDGLGDTFAAIRVLSLARDISQPIDLYSGELPVLGATNVTFQAPTPYRFVEAGDAKLSFRQVGTALSLPTLARGAKLLPGKSYTVLIYGETGKTLDAAIIQEP